MDTPNAFAKDVFMPKTRVPYSPEFRCQMVDLVRAGRDPDNLPASSNRRRSRSATGLCRSDKKEVRRDDMLPSLSAAEQNELAWLRREGRQLRVERDIVSNAAAWFARETGAISSGSSGS